MPKFVIVGIKPVCLLAETSCLLLLLWVFRSVKIMNLSYKEGVSVPIYQNEKIIADLQAPSSIWQLNGAKVPQHLLLPGLRQMSFSYMTHNKKS